MNVIKIKIDFEKGLCQKEGISVVTGDYNSTKIEFEFNESAADGRKIFELKNSDDELVYVDEIVNNEVILVGKREEEGEEKLFSLFNKEGDYTFEVSLYGENSKLTSVYDYITARKEQVIVDDETVEQYMPLFDNLMQELSNKVAEADSKIDEIDQAIEEVNQAVEDAEEAVESTNNLNIDVNKVDKTTQVDLTKKDGTTKTVYINDGTSLQFMWQGTSLGIKTDDMEQYVFVDLQGIQGQPGPQGEPFRIKKEYTSVAEMNADFDNMNVGDYVMIASTVEIEDNAKLYVKGDSQWIFITDFSGATGIKGETGATPNIQIGSVTSGSTPSVTRTGTNENPILNFVLQPGEKGSKGDTGATGPTGNGIASIVKTASAGLIDTYTITFTDGTTTTFNVTNGQDGDVTQEYVDEENERLKSVFNVLPKVSDSGESIELENTGDTMLYKVDLKGNTSQEVVSGEVGTEIENTSIYVDDVNEDKENYITLKGNTYQETTTGKNLIYIEPRIASGITPSYDKKTGKISISGTPTSEWISLEAKHNLSIPAGTYTLSLKDSLPFRIIIRFYTDSTNYDEMSIYANNKETTKTFSNNIVATQMWVQLSTSTTYNTNFYIQLEQGSTATDFEPYTNGASPNPDYPQEIEVVTGLNEVKVEGKNLFDKDNANILNAYISLGNSKITSSNGDNCIYIPIKSNTTYTITKILSNRFVIGCTDVLPTTAIVCSPISTNQSSNTTYTITSGNNSKYLVIYCYTVSDTLTLQEILNSIQVEEGSTATTYEAYKGQTYEVNLGKNLFDRNKVSDDNKNKRLSQVGENYNDTGYFVSPYISIKPNTQYIINYTPDAYTRICYYSSNNTSSFISKNDDTATFTTPNNATYLRFCNLLTNIGNIRLEEGTTITNDDIELCKIGTYQDRFYKSNGNWYLHKEIGKVVLTGGENEIWNRTVANDIARFELSGIDYLKGNSYVTDLPTFLSNNFTKQLFNDIANGVETGISWWWASWSSSLKLLIIGFQDSRSLQDFKTWLSTHNTIVYYPLETPTETQIIDTTLISQLNALYNATIYSTTHINTETSNLLPYIDLKYNVVTASPSPDRASEVEVVKGNNVIKVQSKNLLSFTDLSGIAITNGKVDLSSKTSSFGGRFNFNEATLQAGNYCFYFNPKTKPSNSNQNLVDNNGNILGTFQYKNSGYSYCDFTLTEPITINNFGLWLGGGIYNNTLEEISLINGTHSDIGAYVPYQSQSYNITLGNLELCKIGNYQDYFYKENGNWYKYGAIGKVVLDGSNDEEFTNYQYDNSIAMYKDNNLLYITGQSSYCDRFSLELSSISNMTNGEYRISVVSNNTYILFKSEETNNISIFKTWLSNHNTNVYGILTTPTTTQITDQLLVSQLDELQKAMSYYDKTLITQTNASKPFILDVIGIRDLQDIFNLISGE